MEKYILSAMTLIIGVSVQAQCSQSQYNTDILYRGFENKIQINGCESNVKLVSNDCEIIQNGDNFIVKTKSKENPVLHVISDKGDTLNTKTYDLKTVPSPIPFLSGVPSGQKINRSSGLLQVKHGSAVPIKETYEVTAWNFQIGSVSIKGKGTALNEEAKSLLKTGSKGDEINIILTVVDQKGVARKLGGSWVLN